jgi:hypothetical protein
MTLGGARLAGSPHPPLPHTPREGGVWPIPSRKCEKGRRVGAALWRLLLLSCGASKLGRVFAVASEFYEHPTNPPTQTALPFVELDQVQVPALRMARFRWTQPGGLSACGRRCYGFPPLLRSRLPRIGRRGTVPNWRHPPSRAPEHAATHAAEVPPAPQAVGTGRVVLEDVLAVQAAERLQALGVALSPRDPQDRRSSIGSLARLGHSRYSPSLVTSACPNTGREPSIPSPRRISGRIGPPRGCRPSTAPRCRPALTRVGLCRLPSMKCPDRVGCRGRATFVDTRRLPDEGCEAGSVFR